MPDYIHLKSAISRVIEKKKRLIREAKNVPCADCGEKYPPCVMDFDHRRAEEKNFSIGPSVTNKGFSEIMAEIEKCDVVCANCHRLRTFSMSSSSDFIL